MKYTTKTDNAYVAGKLALRRIALDGKTSARVLDCYSGDGLMWGTLKAEGACKIDLTRIEVKKTAKGVYLQGDNLKFMAGMDLSAFDVIDLDAYGAPIEQLDMVMASAFRGWVVVTYITNILGGRNKRLFAEFGMDDRIVKTCPSVLSHYAEAAIFNFLQRRGVDRVHLFAPEGPQNKGFVKLYFTFRK